MPMFKHFSQPVLGTFTVVSKAISPWHDIRVPEDNLGGNVLLKMTSSKAGQNQVGLLALCSAKLWIFPRMKISQLFQQANLLQCCTAYHSPEMATTKAVHSSQKFSSRALYRNSVLKIQPTAPSPRPQEDGIPGEWKLNTTTKEISQVGTEEDVPVSRCVWAGWAVCGFLPPPPTSGADGADSEAGLCVSLWQRALCSAATETFAYSQFHQRISGCLKFPVTLPTFRSASSLSRERKAANGHYYRISRKKHLGVLPRVQGKPASITLIASPAHLPRNYERI